jgi:tetratricopeptide (TPR) repeat protein
VSAPTVGLALIVRDEEKTLPNLLESIEGAFDQIVLVDTGSEDATIDVFEAWADKHEEDLELGVNVCRFTWIDDFAAARAYADSFLRTDWTCWADADDVLRNAQNLRQLAVDAAPDVLGFICGYDYARDHHGNCACYLVRERLVRRGAGEWVGRVHESQLIHGTQSMVSPDVVEWVHNHPPDPSDSNERNLRILEKWIEEAPEDPRVVGYLGTELLIKDEIDRAGELFERYLTLKTGWDEERAQIHRKLGSVRIRQGRHDEAIDTAMEALRLMPQWPDSYLTLAEAYHKRGEWPKAIEWASEVLRRGQPQTMLIVNPLDYTVLPRMVLASALAQLGRIEEALQVAEELLAVVPDHQGLLQARQGWIAQGQRDATAQTFVAAARQLINHDEQLKALILLEQTVPHFAQDHAEVVALRSQLRERVYPLLEPASYAEHYESGGSKPEDFTPDEKVDEIGSYLPRCAFLLGGITEQLEEAAA